MLIVTVLLGYQVFGQLRANRVAEDARWAALFASNFRSIQQGTDYLGAQQEPSPLQHFWSLAVEEQFYFVWPLLILLLASVGEGDPGAAQARRGADPDDRAPRSRTRCI